MLITYFELQQQVIDTGRIEVCCTPIRKSDTLEFSDNRQSRVMSGQLRAELGHIDALDSYSSGATPTLSQTTANHDDVLILIHRAHIISRHVCCSCIWTSLHPHTSGRRLHNNKLVDSLPHYYVSTWRLHFVGSRCIPE